jgi:Domain of unknown function (DUF4177)
MKRKLLAGALLTVLAAILGSLAGRSAAQESEGPPRETHVKPQTRLVPQRQWEYLQLPCMGAGGSEREREDRLNEQGKRGWELVSLLEVEHPPVRGCILATFKRPVLN